MNLGLHGARPEASYKKAMYGLDREFPHLSNTNHQLTSPRTEDYNCIAWAANDEERWWWPIGEIGGVEAYWPPGVRRSLAVDSFVEAFATLGYAVSDDGSLLSGTEKVALYVDHSNIPTHMARQLPNGQWSSKLGPGTILVTSPWMSLQALLTVLLRCI